VRKTTLLGMMTLPLLALAPRLAAQVETDVPPPFPGAKPVTVERIQIHGTALEGNLEGNAVDRDVIGFLPPGYASETSRRYPVVYALHGYSIVVLPDSKTLHNGSMYSSSVATGDFESFVARDVVSYLDAHYRTLEGRASRGLVGHSMGGYGASRIGMRHADMFGGLYVMSATAAAWSPNPKNPPLYLDLPTKDGVPQPDVLAKWAANAPLAFVDQYVASLRRYRAIAIDVGDQDGTRVDAGKLHDALDRYGIAHGFEIYPGNHTNKVADRFQNHVMRFFSQKLCFQADCR